MVSPPDMPQAQPTAPKQPKPASAPQGTKPKRKSMQQTFLGEGSTPEMGQLPNKTLLGQ